jgi:anti-sigma B factor antagonist
MNSEARHPADERTAARREGRRPGSPVKSIRWSGRNCVAALAGNIDLEHSTAFQQELLSLLDGRPERLVLDFAEVGFMDSSGVASLVKLLSRTRRSATHLLLTNLGDDVRGILEVTRLDTVFDIRGSIEEALM